MITLEEIENAFQPSREISSADRFAGRQNFVSDAYHALIGEGTNLAVVGNRGIGKTSLARQISLISRGNNDLLEKLNFSKYRKLDFLTIYYACGNSITTLDQLLEQILTTSTCFGDWIYDIPKAKSEVQSFSPELSAKVFGIDAKLVH